MILKKINKMCKSKSVFETSSKQIINLIIISIEFCLEYKTTFILCTSLYLDNLIGIPLKKKKNEKKSFLPRIYHHHDDVT